MSMAKLLTAAGLLALVACTSTITLQVRGVDPLNINDANESTPVDIRIYQLKDEARFKAAPFEDLWVDAKKVLAEDLLTEKTVTVFPGKPEDEPKRVELGKAHQDARFVGIVALFSKSDGKPRHQVLPVSDASGKIWKISGYHIVLTD